MWPWYTASISGRYLNWFPGNENSQMNILVTGISGFVGKNMIRYFQQQKGISLYGHSRHPENASQSTGLPVTQFLPNITKEALDKHGISATVHLAGIAHDIAGAFTEEDYQKGNFENTCRVFEAFNQSSARKFIFLSSIKAVADQATGLITENTKPEPGTPYGRSKRMAEKHILSSAKADKKIYLLRPCMIHGPENKGNLNLLDKLVQKGIPYPLGLFQNQRSFLSIDNLLFVVDHLLTTDVKSGVYNLADDGFLDTKELVCLLANANGKKPRIWNWPIGMVKSLAKLGDLLNLPLNQQSLGKLTESYQVSNKKIKDAIGAPLPVSMEEGLKKTIAHFHGVD